jgi:hypothetical protein
MEGLFDVSEVRHRIRVKLHPSYLPGMKGEYVARTDNERMLSIREICGALHTRGGSTDSVEDLIKHVELFVKETCYQLGDGFAVNLGGFSIHPTVGGTFDKETRGVVSEPHPVDFHFRVLAPLRDLADQIKVFVEGVADSGAYIDTFTDVATETVNEKVTAGGVFSLVGSKIRVTGDPDKTGVYFVVPDDPAADVKAVSRFAVNSRSKIIGVIPQLPPGKTWALEVRTQYANSPKPLKTVRVVRSDFTLLS